MKQLTIIIQCPDSHIDGIENKLTDFITDLQINPLAGYEILGMEVHEIEEKR